MKTAQDGWGGDPYPGEQPETQAVAEQTRPRPDYTQRKVPEPATYHNWVIISGHVVMDSNRSPEQMVEDHGFKNLDKALAYGRVAVQHRWTANFQIIHTNVGLSIVLKALKKYAKEQGWGDIAFVDHNGEELAINKAASIHLADDPGSGWQTVPKDWTRNDKNPGSDIQFGEFWENPPTDAPPGSLYQCPECGLELPDYTSFREHLMGEKQSQIGTIDEPDIAPIDHDKVMPADWNNSTTPDWIGIMSSLQKAALTGAISVGSIPDDLLEGYQDKRHFPGGEPRRHMVTGEPSNAGATHPYYKHDPNLHSFIDVFEEPHRVNVAYMHTRNDLQQNGNAKALMQHVYDSYPGKQINHSERMHDASEKIYDQMSQQYPERTAAAPQAKLPGPIPFIFDIEDDRVYVGFPGEEITDVNAGDYNPLGIVEGIYLPTGQVEITTQTNMPYTIRHMIQLWYYMHPELEVKGVTMKWEDGKSQKLAGVDVEPEDWYYVKVSAAPDNVGEKIQHLLEADPAAVETYKALAPLGNVYVVGGAIRDLALGKIPKDIDIMAQGIEPDDVIKALELRPGHVEVTGNQFPVIRYFHPSGYQCEIALPRREQSTGGGGRKDFEVQMDVNMPVEEDLERRDFTGNSMAVDLKTGQLIDPYGGWEHLENGELKMVHPNAFLDDATRILRALSSHSRHGLQPDQETMDAMRQYAARIGTHVPNEQKSAELEKLLSGDDPASAIELAQQTGVLEHILPELAETHGFDQKSKYHNQLLFDHIVSVLRETAKHNKDPDVRMAALLHDIGKPGSQWFDDEGYGHYYQKKNDDGTFQGLDHEHHGADLARERLKELTWGNRERQKRVEHLVRSHMFAPFDNPKGARKFLHKYDPNDEGHATDLMDIRHADSGNKANPWDGDTANMRTLLEQAKETAAPTNLSALALNGNDIIQILGIKPGKEVGEHLQRLQEIVLEDPSLNTREDLTQALMMKTAKRGWATYSKEFDGWCWALLPKESPIKDAPDADNSHLTLAMVKGMDGMDEERAGKIAEKISTPMTVKITGCTAFPKGDDGAPVVLIMSSPDIDAARETITEALDMAGCDYSSDYGFIPHMTLGFANKDEEIKALTEQGDKLIGEEITFDRSVYSGGDGVWKIKGEAQKIANILDPIQETLDPDVFENADKAKPKVKSYVNEWIHKKVEALMVGAGKAELLDHMKLVMTGSLTSYQWSHKSDFDVSVWFDYAKFPNIVRADLISLMVEELDGVVVPGTTHELQCYIVPNDVTPEELYQPGLRSAFDLDKNKWMVAPERDRVYNPYQEVPALMGWVHDQAEKLKLLQNYDPPGAEEFLRQIHTRRQRDQKAGKGDFSESNLVWKYIEHMGLV